MVRSYKDFQGYQKHVKEIDEKRFQRIITKELNSKSKGQRTLQILEVFNAVVTETINSIINKYSECVKTRPIKSNSALDCVLTEEQNEKITFCFTKIAWLLTHWQYILHKLVKL